MQGNKKANTADTGTVLRVADFFRKHTDSRLLVACRLFFMIDVVGLGEVARGCDREQQRLLLWLDDELFNLDLIILLRLV
mmetsp:Transcript_6196/g.12743  ORF Transcript_6196/g.12743 Transcript_6196/m.12743 type:complete len:80 (-) Transcript_6196:74-313(-)